MKTIKLTDLQLTTVDFAVGVGIASARKSLQRYVTDLEALCEDPLCDEDTLDELESLMAWAAESVRQQEDARQALRKD